MELKHIFGIHDGGFVLLACVFFGIGIYGIKSGQTWGRGTNMVLRDESPGSYWFLISLHFLIGTGILIYGLFGLTPRDLWLGFTGG